MCDQCILAVYWSTLYLDDFSLADFELEGLVCAGIAVKHLQGSHDNHMTYMYQKKPCYKCTPKQQPVVYMYVQSVAKQDKN